MIPIGINAMVADFGSKNFLAESHAKCTATNVSRPAIILRLKGHLASIKILLVDVPDVVRNAKMESR